MTRITEYVGKEGVISSTYDHSRASRPRPGDVFQWNTGEYGRIEVIREPFEDGGPKMVHCCYSMGSAFLGLITPDLSDHQQESVANCPEHIRDNVRRAIQLNNSRIYLSISGGPFLHVPVDEFQCTYALHPSTVWNWGDNLAGADKGVTYTLHRPLFKLDRPKPRS